MQVPGGYFYVPDPGVTWNPREPEFICEQTGSSTSLLIRYRDKSWLVNTGTESQFKYVTNPLRKFYGVNHLNGAILTEFSSLEAGGALALHSEGMVARWMTPPPTRISRTLEPWQRAMQQQSTPREIWTRGQVETLAPDFTLTVLAPGTNDDAQRMEHRGLALFFRFKNHSLLYAGRIGPDVETQILQSGLPPRADVLVQGPHSGPPNLPLQWLEAVHPQQVIIAAPSPYDTNQHVNSIELMPEKTRPRVWYQEETGAVTVRLKEAGIELVPFVKENTATDRPY